MAQSSSIIPGQVFHSFTVLQESGRSANGGVRWRCRCVCGKERIVGTDNLKRGTSKSCGCLFGREEHGKYDTPECRAWIGMKSRCFNPHNISYRNYGARGITVCSQWQHSFNNFFNDMGPRPSLHHSLERRDVNGHYCKENCCWATRTQQANNTRRSFRITFHGETKTLQQWANLLRMEYQTLRCRIRHGWSLDRAFTEPVHTHHRQVTE